MALEAFLQKLEDDKKTRPYSRRTVFIGLDGTMQEIKQDVSLVELLANNKGWHPNPEDPRGDEEKWQR